MARVAPLRALRPAPSAAARVAAPPYDVVSTEQARALASGNPLSFLHVSRAEIDLPSGTAFNADAVYERASANFRRLQVEAPFFREDEPSLYLYRLRSVTHEQTGLAGGYSLEDYARNLIRRHERTRQDKEDDRTRHLLALRAQTGPVFLVYRALPTVDALVHQVKATAPEYDFRADDGVHHTLWHVGAQEARRLVREFAAVPALYIADGHHRAASAARARQRLAGPSETPGAWDWLLGVAFPDSQVRIQPYNRVVTDLRGMTPSAFLDALRSRFPVKEGPGLPERRGDVAVLVDGQWRTIVLRTASGEDSPVRRLDVLRLQEAVLAPLLGIEDVSTDGRIDFIGGGPVELEERVRSGAAAVAFSLYPVDISDLMAVSDAGGVMPPKSTWFEPKLRDGLLCHLV